MKFQCDIRDYPADECRRLVLFAAQGVGKRGVSVHVKSRDRSISGLARQEAGKCQITLLFGPRSTLGQFVMQTLVMRDVYSEIPCGSWRDAVVFIAAHEFRHIHQFRYREGPSSETDADEHAIKMLNRWRILTGRKSVRPRRSGAYLPKPVLKYFAAHLRDSGIRVRYNATNVVW